MVGNKCVIRGISIELLLLTALVLQRAGAGLQAHLRSTARELRRSQKHTHTMCHVPCSSRVTGVCAPPCTKPDEPSRKSRSDQSYIVSIVKYTDSSAPPTPGPTKRPPTMRPQIPHGVLQGRFFFRSIHPRGGGARLRRQAAAGAGTDTCGCGCLARRRADSWPRRRRPDIRVRACVDPLICGCLVAVRRCSGGFERTSFVGVCLLHLGASAWGSSRCEGLVR